ncbi:alpha/beta hydrolase [Labrys wisconsinensis]|uniref:Esterase/lipase superfamily enzyme n=1 Tax=Labrys wisconsinensis TaxID=425677 RepID=A0ABU0J1W1_9HYPH|nr:alpha/beta fold hydrolase [Labrys wisconsinensis]MDQ0467309.1 esterase/lipase superfamily enzyme [Labrys wisconsinensis]
MRTGLRLAAAMVLAASLAACGERPGSLLLHPVEATGVGTPVSVLVATTRDRSTQDRYAFTDGRSRTLNYERYQISIPPTHVTGTIEWPDRPPGDPARNFVVTRSETLDRAAFDADLAARQPGGKPASGDVVVFVHGYNTNYQEAVFRVAQLTKDGGFPGTMVAFAWPSRGTLTGYVADRESTTYSRDYLEQFLDDVARAPGVKRIHILAHSMGNWLAVETLRQAKLRASSPFLAKLGDVFLMSPDIDVDVFRTQLDVIGKLNEPITVIVSRDDRALAASQRLAGDVPRVGNVLVDTPQAQAAIKQYGLRVIDLSDQASEDTMRHSKFLNILPTLHDVVARDDLAQRGNPISRTGTFVVDTAGTILTAPLRLGEAVLGQ